MCKLASKCRNSPVKSAFTEALEGKLGLLRLTYSYQEVHGWISHFIIWHFHCEISHVLMKPPTMLSSLIGACDLLFNSACSQSEALSCLSLSVTEVYSVMEGSTSASTEQSCHVLISALLNTLERKTVKRRLPSRFISFIRRFIRVSLKASKNKTALCHDSGFRLRCPQGLVSLFSRVWFWWRASTLCVSTSSWSALTHSPVEHREQAEPNSPEWWGCFFRGFQARNFLWTRLHRSLFHRQGEDWSTLVFPSCYLQPLWRLRSFVCFRHIQAR